MEDRLNQITDQLRQAKPVPEHPELLTDSIMDRIGRLQDEAFVRETLGSDENRPSSLPDGEWFPKTTPPLLLWVRTTLSIAAAGLIALFLVQKGYAEEPTPEANPTSVHAPAWRMEPACAEPTGPGEGSLFDSYLCHLRQNRIDNQSFRNLLHPKNEKR